MANKKPRRVLTEAEKAKAKADKRARFLKVAPKRTNRAIKAIRAVARCTGSGYTFTPKEAEAIVKAITEECRKLGVSFSGQHEAEASFSLPA